MKNEDNESWYGLYINDELYQVKKFPFYPVIFDFNVAFNSWQKIEILEVFVMKK